MKSETETICVLYAACGRAVDAVQVQQGAHHVGNTYSKVGWPGRDPGLPASSHPMGVRGYYDR